MTVLKIRQEAFKINLMKSNTTLSMYATLPHQYPNRILLVIIGLTPQIVTETLYKLAVEQDPAFIPTEIHIITTAEGAESAQLALLGTNQNQGWFHRLLADYDLPDMQFDAAKIHIIKDTEGRFIDDNQSTEHNRYAANFITTTVRSFTHRRQNERLAVIPDTALHVSLAGGRKTMSFYAGYALSLYGREQDRLSHVLVDPVFQRNKDFFYPRPNAAAIEIDKKWYDPNQANVILSDIPFVRMQRKIPTELLKGNEGFWETVDTIEQFNRLPPVVLSIADKTLRIGPTQIKASPKEFAYFLWLCHRKLSGKGPVVFMLKNYFNDYLPIYARVVGKGSGYYEKAELLAEEVGKTIDSSNRFDEQKDYFQAAASRLKSKIIGALGEEIAAPYLVKTVTTTKPPHTGYTVNLPEELIRIEGV